MCLERISHRWRSAGTTILSALREEGLSTSHVLKLGGGARTAQYVSVNDSKKSLVLAMADMDILTDPPFLHDHWSAAIRGSRPKCLVVDANWTPTAIRSLLSCAGGALTVFEPVSVAKSVRLFEGEEKLRVYPDHQVSLATPNIHELSAMDDEAREQGYFHMNPAWFEAIDRFNIRGSEVDYGQAFERLMGRTSRHMKASRIPQKLLHLLPYIPSIVVKLGARGCILAEIMAPDDPRLNGSDLAHPDAVLTRAVPGADGHRVGGLYMRYCPSEELVADVVSVNGVGDTFLGVLAAGLAKGQTLHELMGLAQRAAVMTLRSKEAVSPRLGELSADVRYLWQEEMSKAPLPGDDLPATSPVGLMENEDRARPQDEAYADAFPKEEDGILNGTSYIGGQLKDEDYDGVGNMATAEHVPEGDDVGKDEQTVADMPVAEMTTESSAGGQENLSAKSVPDSSKAAVYEEPMQNIPVAKRIQQALESTGLTTEQAEQAIRDFVASVTSWELAKLKSDYRKGKTAPRAAAMAAIAESGLESNTAVGHGGPVANILLARSIRHALTDAGLTMEQAERSIRDLIVSEISWEFAKWEADYKKKKAAKKVAAKAAAAAAAVARDDAQGKGKWGAFARMGRKDTHLGQWEVFQEGTATMSGEVVDIDSEEGQPKKVVGQEKRTWGTFARRG